MTSEPALQGNGCPFHASGVSQGYTRKGSFPQEALTPAYEVKQTPSGEHWIIRSLALARTVLRDAEGTKQAGFAAELVNDMAFRQRHPPVIHLEGDEHKTQRTAIARFFTPQTVGRDYRELMEKLSDRLVGEFRARGQADLTELSMELAVAVAGQVVGLTHASPQKTGKRLNALIGGGTPTGFSWRPSKLWAILKSQVALLRFLLQDVRPAIRARRKKPQEDVISHLLSKDYSESEILTECITYGAAGMVTTREFITMAAWHLLDNDPLREQYLASDETERQRILSEILRLEPVIRQLSRRTTRALILNHEGKTFTIPEGALVSFDLAATNVDADLVGELPLELCPERKLSRGVQSAALSFGDGHHRCPGAFLAIQESDIFLSRLFAQPLRADGPPVVSYNELVTSYELQAFTIRAA